MNANVENFFNTLDPQVVNNYKTYWGDVTPKNDEEVFLRYIFAFLSIRTTWQKNIAAYNELKAYKGWLKNKKRLTHKLTKVKCGMQNNRTEWIYSFAKAYWANPKAYQKSPDETWTEMRERLVKNNKGIGLAKISFSLEMIYPNETEVFCIDTHMQKLYDKPLKGHDDIKTYTELEQDWLKRSMASNIPPYIARCIYWDMVQNYKDSRYWSSVLEA